MGECEKLNKSLIFAEYLYFIHFSYIIEADSDYISIFIYTQFLDGKVSMPLLFPSLKQINISDYSMRMVLSFEGL